MPDLLDAVQQAENASVNLVGWGTGARIDALKESMERSAKNATAAGQFMALPRTPKIAFFQTEPAFVLKILSGNDARASSVLSRKALVCGCTLS